MQITQKTAPLAVETVLGSDAVQIQRLQWREKLGEPFEGDLDLVAADPAIDLGRMLKTALGIRIDRPDGTPVYLHGYVARFENLGPAGRLTRYRARVVPTLALLKHCGGSRIFQDFTTLEIVKKLFSQYGFSGELESRLESQYTKREYCVQYAESDYHFLSRILSEDGIYYFFEYSKDKHTLILADDMQAHRPAIGNAQLEYRESRSTKLDEYLCDFVESRQFGIGGVELRDYDFEKPKTPLQAKQLGEDGPVDWIWYEYPGDFTENDRGQQLATIRQQAEDSAASWVTFSGSARSLRCGNMFKLKDHETTEFNTLYLVTGMHITASMAGFQSGDLENFDYTVGVQAQPAKLPYRTRSTLRHITMPGPQVATVCGKAGEEIWTDSYGRIKVQFAWDREGKSDEHSSCWIRVAQAWTGKNWGAMSLPRIGDEVIVQFVDGDPDRPIVVGRVYNGERLPPEELAAAQAKTIFRTRSTKGGDLTNFHELSFDDTKDEEAIYLHSERDFKRVVENNDVTLIGFEKQSPGDQSLEIYNDSNIKVGAGSGQGSMSVEIEKDRSVKIATGNDTLNVAQGDLATSVEQGNLITSVAAGSCSIEAAKSIELKCGQSTIVISPGSIELKSPAIKLNATGELDMKAAQASLAASGVFNVKGAMGTVEGSGMLTVKGGVVMVN